MTATAGLLAPASARVDRRRAEIKAVLRDQAQADRHRDALRALNELNQIEAAIARNRMKDRTTAFRAVADALDAAAARMTANVFADAIDDVRLVVRTAGLEEPAGAPPPDHRVDVLDDLVAGALEGIDEAVLVDAERAANEPTPAGADDEQARVIAAIVSAARDRGVGEGLLGAVAWVESRLRNVQSANSTARGPFQFLPRTWNAMAAQVGAQLGISEADIDDVDKQAVMAAEAFKGYRRSLEQTGITVSRSRMYLCHLLGSGAARACLSAAPEIAIDVPLRELYARTQLGAGFVDRILEANPFLREEDGGGARSTGAVLERIGDVLDRAEGKYFELRGAAPKPAEETAPRWFRIALGELEKGVAEVAGDEHHPSIVAYLATTTLPSGLLKDETPWCSAFVNWCLREAGVVGTNDALARSWERYGTAPQRPRLGDIAVFWRVSPTSGKGHVGFFMGEDEDTVTILGGNQDLQAGRDGISIRAMTRGELLGYRRPPAT